MATLNVQSSFAAGELAPSLHSRIDLAKTQTGAKTIKNMFVHAHGGVSNRPGTKFITPVHDETQVTRLVPFSFSTTQTYVLEFGHQIMRVIKDGGLVIDPNTDNVVTVKTPFTSAELSELKYAQSADVIYLVHPNHAPQTLSRTDHHVWAFETISFEPSISAPTNARLKAENHAGTAFTWRYKVTAIAREDSEESYASNIVEVPGDAEHDWANSEYIEIEWDAVPEADRYVIYKEENGVYGFIGHAEDKTFFRDDKIAPELADTPPKPRNPFEEGNNPSSVTFHEQRLSFAASTDKPQTMWMSQSGHYHNMSVSTPTKDDDAITFTIASREVNAIRHFISLTELLVLTSGGVWKVDSSDNGPITPSSVRVRQQEAGGGASHVTPIAIGGTVLFIEDKGTRIRDLIYTLDSDSYSGRDLSVLANHLFEGYRIVDWAYAREPHSIIWCIRDDGVLLGLTYMREHKVWAWHKHITDGLFESVTTVSEGQEDAVYFVIKRTINGMERRYVERFASRTISHISDAFFVDCGLSYEGDPADEISGLDHLEGQKVAILADGNVVSSKIIENGRIVLPYEASKVHIGLPYSSDLEPLAFEGRAAEGPLLARKRQIARVRVSLLNSRGLWVGPDKENQVEFKQRKFEPMGSAIQLHSGIVDVAIPPSWGNSGGLVLSQRDPLPLTILAVLPEIASGA